MERRPNFGRPYIDLVKDEFGMIYIEKFVIN